MDFFDLLSEGLQAALVIDDQVGLLSAFGSGDLRGHDGLDRLAGQVTALHDAGDLGLFFTVHGDDLDRVEPISRQGLGGALPCLCFFKPQRHHVERIRSNCLLKERLCLGSNHGVKNGFKPQTLRRVRENHRPDFGPVKATVGGNDRVTKCLPQGRDGGPMSSGHGVGNLVRIDDGNPSVSKDLGDLRLAAADSSGQDNDAIRQGQPTQLIPRVRGQGQRQSVVASASLRRRARRF